MAGASVESCRFVVLRSPGGGLGSELDMGNRLHRMRGRFHRWIHISKVLCALLLWPMICHYKGQDSNLKMTSLPGDLCVDATALRKESSITGQKCIKSRQQKWKIQKL